MRWTAICAVLALIPASAGAEEPAVQLKQAPGVDVVAGQCGACHSLDYIVINSPFLDAGKWDAEVAKMIKAFGAANRSGGRQDHWGLSQAELWGVKRLRGNRH